MGLKAGSIPLLFAVAAPCLAQDSTLVTGTVTGNGAPLGYSTYSISPGDIRRFTSGGGIFGALVPTGRTYRLTVKQLGFREFDTTFTSRPDAGGTQRLRIQLQPVAYRLAAVKSEANRGCSSETSASPELRDILEEVKTNAENAIVLRTRYPFEYSLVRRNTDEAEDWRTSSKPDTATFLSTAFDPYRLGRVVRDRPGRTGAEREMRIPQLEDLGDESFLARHCFSYGGIRRMDHGDTYEIDFEPTRDVLTPDVRGSIFLDARTLEIKRAFFALTRGDALSPPVPNFEVTSTYHPYFGGVSVVDRIESVQTFSRMRATEPMRIHRETQQVRQLRFLKGTPQDLDESALVSSVADEDERREATERFTVADTLRAIRSQLDEDLRKVGFYDRKARFRRAIFLEMTDIDKRIIVDPEHLVHEIHWVNLGVVNKQFAVTSNSCGVNVVANGKATAAQSTSDVVVLGGAIQFGSDLPIARLGALELYPPGTPSPRNFEKSYPDCGLVVLWTRPEIH